MIVGAALFSRNLYQRFWVLDRDDRHYLSVSRLASLGIVGGGLLLTYAFASVAELLVFFWKVTGLVGISFWAGVIWRRANRYGAWASIAGAGLVLLFTSGGTLFGVELGTPLPLAEQIALYLSVGFAPVGQEHKLREAGIQVALE